MMKKLAIITSIISALNINAQTKNVEVEIPEDHYALVESSVDDLPAVIVVNTALRDFKAKDVFGWSCSLIIDYKELAQNGMPTHEESELVYEYFEKLDSAIRGDVNHPNALFLARITWNGTLEAIWQVNDPEIVHKYLQNIIAEKSYPREMDYRIEYDAKWENVSYYTQDFSKQ